MESGKEPHAVSLKVLRLSRPSLLERVPLAPQSKSSSSYIDADAFSDLNSDESDPQFLLNPIITLPPSFGSAYVGETFSCTLCANNELSNDAERQVSSVRIEAEMQSPSGSTPLQTLPAEQQETNYVKPGASIQKIVSFDLREEGSHTLAVNLSYSETTISKDQTASSGRARSFRKLYQFACRPCLNVRTKVSSLQDRQSQKEKYVVEVQLDNLAQGTLVLKDTIFNTKPAFKSTSLNQMTQMGQPLTECPTMAPRDVIQIAFLIEQQDDGNSSRKEVTKDGRTILGQLSIQWRSAMGDSGFLTTGWLSTKKR
ncbi:hypothetical protein ACLMJK_007113 [Lecanora helva]